MSEKKFKRGKAFFSISAVAKMFSVHQQTIRFYEKEGLIQPERSDGNTRMFSEDDVAKLEEIIYLTHQLGINLAGVEMILKLKKKMQKMQKDMNKIFANTQHELNEETNTQKSLIKNYAKQLQQAKQNTVTNKSEFNQNKTATPSNNSSFTDWDIDYEE